MGREGSLGEHHPLQSPPAPSIPALPPSAAVVVSSTAPGNALPLNALCPPSPVQPSSNITLPANTKVLLSACSVPPGTMFRQIVVPPGSEAGCPWGGGGEG